MLPNKSNLEKVNIEENSGPDFDDKTESRTSTDDDDDSPESDIQSDNVPRITNSSMEDLSIATETNHDDDPDYIPPTTSTSHPTVTRSVRDRRPPATLHDFVTYSVFSTGSELSDPGSYDDALLHQDNQLWIGAMERESKAQMNNSTYELVELPASKEPLARKCVFRTKRDTSGKITGHKARLVVKGFAQRRNVDYEETFSPVIRYSSIRYLISLATEYNLDIDQMNAVSAFLQGDLED